MTFPHEQWVRTDPDTGREVGPMSVERWREVTDQPDYLNPTTEPREVARDRDDEPDGPEDMPEYWSWWDPTDPDVLGAQYEQQMVARYGDEDEPERDGIPRDPRDDTDGPREHYVRHAMHTEFVRDDFLDRLAEHAGIRPGDAGTAEQFRAFDEHRRTQHEARYDREHGDAGTPYDRTAVERASRDMERAARERHVRPLVRDRVRERMRTLRQHLPHRNRGAQR